jgi:chitinase
MIAALFCLALLTIASPAQIERQFVSSNMADGVSTAPIKFIYINGLTSWWGNLTIPAALAIPGFTKTVLPYNYVCLSFWTYPGSATDAAGIWSSIGSNMGPNEYGTTTSEIQTTLKKNFTNNGVKFMVSAFGSTQNPTSAGVDAIDCANKLAAFVIANQFDGVDIDWEDTPAFNKGVGEDWLITLTKTLYQLLPPGSIITHAPQSPYFSPGLYPKNAYLTVDQQVGNMISFYNIQFYNQGVGMYDSAVGLFNVSGGWAPKSSINEIIASGVPSEKVILGKPAMTADANNGWMPAGVLNSAIIANYPYNGWKAGIMFWQFTHDLDGSFCNDVSAGILESRSFEKDLPIATA